MTLNPYVDQEAILARVQELATPVFDTIDDLQELERDAAGRIRPVAEVTFGTLFPTSRGRTFAEEDAQPHETYFFITAYGPTKQAVRSIMGECMNAQFLVGWSPSQNASGIYAGGGTEFTVTAVDRPSIYAQRQTFRLILNLANQTL